MLDGGGPKTEDGIITKVRAYKFVWIEDLYDDVGRTGSEESRIAVDLHLLKDDGLVPDRTERMLDDLCLTTTMQKTDVGVRICGIDDEWKK